LVDGVRIRDGDQQDHPVVVREGVKGGGVPTGVPGGGVGNSAAAVQQHHVPVAQILHAQPMVSCIDIEPSEVGLPVFPSPVDNSCVLGRVLDVGQVVALCLAVRFCIGVVSAVIVHYGKTLGKVAGTSDISFAVVSEVPVVTSTCVGGIQVVGTCTPVLTRIRFAWQNECFAVCSFISDSARALV